MSGLGTGSLGARWTAREGVRTWAALTPALLLVAVLFGGAVLQLVLRSLGLVGAGGPGAASLDAYRSLLTDPVVQRSLALTFYVAVLATSLSVLLGIAAALLLRRLVRGRRLATTLFQLNLPIPHVIGAVAVLALVGQSGLLSRLGAQAGVLSEPAAFPAITFDPWAIGVILQYVWKEVPFIGIVALAILAASGTELDEAARTLGASAWQRVRFVTLPLLLPGVLSAAVVVFAFTFGTFEVPLLLGPTSPTVLPVLAHRRYTDIDLSARPEAMALGVLVTVVVIAVVLAGAALARRSIREGSS